MGGVLQPLFFHLRDCARFFLRIEISTQERFCCERLREVRLCDLGQTERWRNLHNEGHFRSARYKLLGDLRKPMERSFMVKVEWARDSEEKALKARVDKVDNSARWIAGSIISSI